MTKLRRSSRDSILGGVCGGLADYFNLDASLVRIGYVVLSFLSAGFPGTLIYILMWIIVPRD